MLTEARILLRIVPGITAAFAVAATLKTPLTDRGAASKLIFATAHHAADRLELTPKWAARSPQDATLVLYMPGRNFGPLADEFIASGIDARTPCIAVSRASTPEERVLRTTLAASLNRHRKRIRLGPAPLLLLIGLAIQSAAHYSDLDLGRHREPRPQHVVAVLLRQVGEVDAHREPLHHLDVVARRVFRRKER